MTEGTITIHNHAVRAQAVQPDLSFTPKFDDANSVIRAYRKRAWESYKNKPLPRMSEEGWRRTNLQEIDFAGFKPVNEGEYETEKYPVGFNEQLAGSKNGGRLLISPVSSDIQIDESLQQQGLVFDSLRNLVVSNPALVEKVLTNANLEVNDKFSALAGALDFNGILLYVPKNLQVPLPLQSVYWAPAEGLAHSIHVFIYLEEGASATYVHEATSPKSEMKDSLHAGLMDIYVGIGAHLNFVELQSWGENVINFTKESVVVERDGSVDWIFGALGSKLTKNYSRLNLVGQGSTGKMSGFYFADHQQHFDHDTKQNHLAASTTSDLLFKGALLDKSRSVWQGMIYVAPQATKTDGYQTNRNLILSREARADSIPGLEILTDDVRCSHGATIGKIDQDQVFYLKSRGMPREVAEKLIVEGFFDPIMQRIPFESVKKRVQEVIEEKMEHIG